MPALVDISLEKHYAQDCRPLALAPAEAKGELSVAILCVQFAWLHPTVSSIPFDRAILATYNYLHGLEQALPI
jgi:hypothetical protein